MVAETDKANAGTHGGFGIGRKNQGCGVRRAKTLSLPQLQSVPGMSDATPKSSGLPLAKRTPEMISLTVIIETQPDGSVDVRRTGKGVEPTEAENLLANALCIAIEHTARDVAIQLKQPVPVCETEGTSHT